MKRKSIKPTESELEILKVLWAHEPLTVREVYERMGAKGGYTTVLKFLQIMAEKGFVNRDESQRAHLYSSAVNEGDVKQQAVKTLASKLFGGSGMRLAMHALSEETVSNAELEEMRSLIEAMDRKRSAEESD